MHAPQTTHSATDTTTSAIGYVVYACIVCVAVAATWASCKTSQTQTQLQSAQSLIDRLPGGVAVVTHDGVITYANAGFEQMTQRSRRVLVGLEAIALMPESVHDQHVEMFASDWGLSSDHRKFVCIPEGRIVRADGSMIACEIRIEPVPHEQSWRIFIDPTTVREIDADPFEGIDANSQ